MLKNVRELEGLDDFKRDGVFYFSSAIGKSLL